MPPNLPAHCPPTLWNYLYIGRFSIAAHDALSNPYTIKFVSILYSKFYGLAHQQCAASLTHTRIIRVREAHQVRRPGKKTMAGVSAKTKLERSEGGGRDTVERTETNCGDCDRTVRSNQNAVLCDLCEHWFHIGCQHMHVNEYRECICMQITKHLGSANCAIIE